MLQIYGSSHTNNENDESFVLDSSLTAGIVLPQSGN
jgi:hypothetical protein